SPAPARGSGKPSERGPPSRTIVVFSLFTQRFLDRILVILALRELSGLVCDFFVDSGLIALGFFHFLVERCSLSFQVLQFLQLFIRRRTRASRHERPGRKEDEKYQCLRNFSHVVLSVNFHDEYHVP